MRRLLRARPSSKVRTARPKFDALEARQMLSTTQAVGPQPIPLAGQVSNPMFEVGPLVANNLPPSGAYTPAQIAQAYNFNGITFGSVKGDGSGQTIAIVDAYSDPNIQADLNAFDTQFGVPATTVTQVNETGGTSLPAADSSGGWEMEEALDVEWAHAMAPGARIVLVAASSAYDNDLLQAVSYASSVANVVSMSWGGGEFSGENTYDGYFSKTGVTFVASSGDNGAPIEWPAASPNVVAVGGTSLRVGSGGVYSSESGWSGSGGGPSAYESQPTYQAGVVTQTTTRANPDVSYNGDPNTGYAVYDSYPQNGTSYGWLQVGGTSAGAPQWAALIAVADQGRSLAGKAVLDSTGAQEVQTTLYKNANAGLFHDVTTGSSAGNPTYAAGAGYDYVTGIGSPIANLVVQALVGTTTISPTPDHLVVSAPSADVAGNTVSVTVTADTSGNAVDANYTGAVRFSSTDVQAGLPASYTFTSADRGSHMFVVTLKSAGSQTVTATDTTSRAGAATTSAIAVSPAAASQFVLSGLASSATAGSPQSVVVTAKDAYSNVATGYAGTVAFTSSDAAAILPASYAFTTADAGRHTFSVTFRTAGTQSLTASDATTTRFSATQSGIAVSPTAPTSLAATAASTSQINLAWTAAAGATGYAIQRSSNGSAWTTVTTVAAGTTSYADTGLAAGTTYSYRVQATGGNGSAFSNTATATTASAPAPVVPSTSIWGNTVPTINATTSGSYDLGVKFESSAAGTVTGVRFFKQTWMSGYTHVAYLWSSTGQLLASATFTGESSSGWQQVTFSNPVAIAANAVYVVSFSTGGGDAGVTVGYFSSAGSSNGSLTAPSSGAVGGNGVYGSGNSAFPSRATNGMNFWVDVVFSPPSSGSVAKASTTSATTAPRTIALGSVSPTQPTSATVSAETSRPIPAPSTAPVRAQVTTYVPQPITSTGFRRRGVSAFVEAGV